jgi:Zn-dependent protease
VFKNRFKLFRLFGFDVHVDPSWIIIAVLVVWSLAATFFPAEYPDLSAAAYLWMAVVAAVLFFLSIIVHEFCHALVAKRYGLPMRGITLWMFGGVAEMTDEPPSPKAEFLMAGAGPLASLGIALVAYGIARTSEIQGWGIGVHAVFAYLWRINLILAIFNLIPAFPLDGGRLLRATLWAWKDQIRWATRIASRIGGGFGILMMILGVFGFVTGNPIGGLWYFLIGLFIRSAAQASFSHLLVRDSLKDVTLRRFIKMQPVAVRPNASIETLLEDYFYRFQHRMFPVADVNGRLLGCVKSERIRDIQKQERPHRMVAEIMEPCNDDNTMPVLTDAFTAMQKMRRSGTDRVIATDGDEVAGVVSLNELLRFASMKMELDDLEAEEGGSDRSRISGTRLRTADGLTAR